MKDLQRHYMMKWQLTLISNIKRKQTANINHKLLGVQIKQLQNKELRLMLQLLLLNDGVTRVELAETEQRIEEYLKQQKMMSQTYRDMRLLKLKVMAMGLTQQIKRSDIESITAATKRVLSNILTLQQMQYLFKIMFHVNSLFQLAIADVEKIIKHNSNTAQNNSLKIIIALAKFSNGNENEARQILKRAQLQKFQTVQQFLTRRQSVLCALKLFIERQKQMLVDHKSIHSAVKQRSISQMLMVISEKKTICNLLQNDFKLHLNEGRQAVAENISKLDQINRIIAAAIANVYYQNNSDVFARVRETVFFKYITTSKSFFVDNEDTFSQNASSISNILAKSSLTHKKFKVSPKLYEQYIKLSELKNQDTYAPFCHAGEYFVKYNFNNSKFGVKFVQFNEEQLRWDVKKESVQSGTRWKTPNIIGVVYGKVTHRHLHSKIPSRLCFSLILQYRTLDLACQKQEDISSVFSFVRGSMAIINEMHRRHQMQYQKKIRQEKETAKGKKEELRTQMLYHLLKVQQMTRGKLIWKSLFMSLTSNLNSDETNCYTRKTKAIQQIGKRMEKDSMDT